MPISVSYPGVYVDELPAGVRSIAGVSTAITAFVGAACDGSPERPHASFQSCGVLFIARSASYSRLHDTSARTVPSRDRVD